jgi:hypothetical protein
VEKVVILGKSTFTQNFKKNKKSLAYLAGCED